VKRLGKQQPRHSRSAELVIERLGALGDGIGRLAGRPVYVPFAVPGDRLRVRLDTPRGDGVAARISEILASGPARVAAPCPRFGQCGGCALQHLRDADYAEWKSAQLRSALSRRNLGDVPVRPLVRIPPGTRRRATLAAERTGPTVHLGFNARASHHIVDASECLVLTSALMKVLQPLRAALATVLPEGARANVTVTSSETGVDMLIAGREELSLAARETLAALAAHADIARVTWQGEPVAIRRTPRMIFGGIPVDLPPGAFLQPTAAGEAALVAVVADGLAGCKSVADLYAGCGTFAFPLAVRAHVHAVEGDEEAVNAMAAAARRAGLASRVTTAQRDLARDPLTEQELAHFDGLVFDPPRAGAKAQAEMLARSNVATVVAVSCDPPTFARDARILVDGGYQLREMTPIDQFIWSSHLELVALFQR